MLGAVHYLANTISTVIPGSGIPIHRVFLQTVKGCHHKRENGVCYILFLPVFLEGEYRGINQEIQVGSQFQFSKGQSP